MAKKKKPENQTPEELKTAYFDLSKQIYEMKNEISTTHKLEKPHLLRKAKKDRARVMTLLNKK